jgi:hypothetical protein
VNEGDALFHVARFESVIDAANLVSEFNEEYSPEMLSTPHTESPII